MNKEFVMRGKTASGGTEVLNFSGNTPGYAYRLTEFSLFPSTAVGGTNVELEATLTAGKTFEDPENPDFNNEGLIGTALFGMTTSSSNPKQGYSVINDTFLITQDLILAVVDTQVGSPTATNWQCRFVAEKMSSNEEAVTNFKQFSISSD